MVKRRFILDTLTEFDEHFAGKFIKRIVPDADELNGNILRFVLVLRVIQKVISEHGAQLIGIGL